MRVGLAAVLAVALAGPSWAQEIELGSIRIVTPAGYIRADEFRRNIIGTLRAMQKKSPELARIVKAAQDAPFEITLRPITDDLTTHMRGEGFRSHSHAVGPRTIGPGGLAGYPAMIYLNIALVNPWDFGYKRGTLPHELIHGIDYAYGRVHPDRAVMERRAVFVGNLWRDLHGWGLAETYNGEFETLEYQRAKSRGAITRCVDMILTVSAFDCP